MRYAIQKIQPEENELVVVVVSLQGTSIELWLRPMKHLFGVFRVQNGYSLFPEGATVQISNDLSTIEQLIPPPKRPD